MRFVITAMSFLAVFLGLNASNAAPPASSSSASGPTIQVWNVPKDVYIRRIYAAGEVVFAYGHSMNGTILYRLKLDTKTGKWTDANELIPDEAGSSSQRLDIVYPSPDGKHALIGCTYASPHFESQLYLLEIGNDKAVAVKASLPEGSGLMPVWRGNDSFLISTWASGNGPTRLKKPVLFDVTGKKISECEGYVFIWGASADGKAIIGVGDPDHLTEPPEPGRIFPKLGRLLVMDENLKVLRTIDAMPAGTISPNGKYVGIQRRPPSTQPTTARFSNYSVIATDGKWEGPVLSNPNMIAIYTCDDGDLLCLTVLPENAVETTDKLIRLDRQGQETVLMTHVLAAAVSGDTLYYIQEPPKLKAVKLSALK